MFAPFGFAVMVLAASTVASAQPKQEETSGRVSHSEKRADAKQDAPRHPAEWVELADASTVKHGTTYVMVGRDAGYFGTLRIDAAKGKVVVTVGNG